jgi:hypothetical protein
MVVGVHYQRRCALTGITLYLGGPVNVELVSQIDKRLQFD